MKKFITSSTSNLIVEGSIQVNGLKFYTEQSLVNLNLLYDSLRDYILATTRKYTSDEFANITNTVDNAGIKQIVASKLYIAENQLINESDITSVSFNTTSNQLEITLNSSYKKYSLSGSDNVVWENGKLVVKNLSFYTAISITQEKLNGLQSFVQSYINQASNQYTLSEFNDQVDGDDFRDAIANYLSINNLLINTISFANNTLTISPLTLQKFTSTEKNSVLVNGSLQVSNFDFFTSYTFTKLNDLSNALNSWITNSTRTYTSEEFATNFSANSTTIKDLVLKNLYISENQTIDSSKISSVAFNPDTN
ncbi:MAG: hypothetical protein K2I49_02595, partial [Ureaplasma sp.]|nr:hypothetical protein [Ureaplasma sp.]